MPITASKLRENVYRILDEVLKTGQPVEISRHGRILKIVGEKTTPGSRLQGLKRRPGVLKGDPEAIVHMDWSSEWNP